MERRSITQNALFENSGVNRALISHYLTGRVEPSAKNVKKIAEFFGVSMDWLMGGEEVGQMKVAEPGAAYNAGGLIDQISKLNKRDREIVATLVETLLKRGSKK